MKKIIDYSRKKCTVDRYYKMSDAQLEQEAAKFNIQEYAYESGKISRERIIDQLLKKDSANNSRVAIWISLLALLISVISIIINFFRK